MKDLLSLKRNKDFPAGMKIEGVSSIRYVSKAPGEMPGIVSKKVRSS